MKRLETILPHLKPGHFDSKTLTYTFKESGQEIPLSDRAFSFLQLCNGSYSVKEICLLVYSRESMFSFTEIYENLENWAAQGFFRNSTDISATFQAPVQPSAPPPYKELSNTEMLLALRKVGLFSNFTEAALKHIISVSISQKFTKGQAIITKGSAAKDIFILLSGSAGVYLTPYALDPTAHIAVFPLYTLFGESAAFADQKRTADVVATSDSQVLRIPLERLNQNHPDFNHDVSKNLNLRLIFSQMIKTHPLFKNLPGDVIQQLLRGCRLEKIPSQTMVIEQGSEGQDFYFILSGSVQVVKDEIPQAFLNAGNYFGEMGGLLKQTRSASIITQTECVFLVLSVKNFISILTSNLKLAVEIEKMVHVRRGATIDETSATNPPPTEQTHSEITFTDEMTKELSHSVTNFTNFDFGALSNTDSES